MKLQKTHGIALGGVALLLALPLFAFAATFHVGEQVNLAPGETVNDDLYATGGTVTSAARIGGDLYAGGGTILVSGPIGADLTVGGGSITITGDIGDDLRAGGGTIVVQGNVQGDVLIGGGQVHLAGSRIGGDVHIGGGVVRIDAAVGKDVKISGGEVYLNAPVMGNVEVEADKLTLGPKARVAGNLTYSSPREAVLESGATVLGETIFNEQVNRMSGRGLLLAIFSAVALAFLLMLVVGAFIFVFFFKRYATEVVGNAFGSPLLELGRGLLVFVAMPVISVLLLITIIGIPFGLLGLLLYAALVIFSWLMTPVLIGSLVYHYLYKGEYQVSWKTVLIGVTVFFVMGFVPIAGGLLQFGFMLLSLGSIARLKWHIAKSWR
ncbi:MAG: polymer-forming cytoskeletal protein, partial [Patescibacteria group bacterium]|nr:polymer-forming cytoskeletal protein [Patescibacteria group bacterium]